MMGVPGSSVIEADVLTPRQHSMPFVTYPTTQGMPWPVGAPGSTTS